MVTTAVQQSSATDVDRAVRSAHQAYLDWREMPVVDRVQVLYRYKALLEQHAAGLAQILSDENGKLLDDAQAESAAASRWWKLPAACPAS
jgi:malonate-semialdehyde dehydrogenase (acetylating)/methylmalonate-semialdehyde dehydrogenase